MFAMIKDITLGDMPRFYKAIFWTTISELAKFGAIFIVLWFVWAMLRPFLDANSPEATLQELLLICGVGFAYMIVCYFLSLPGYKATFVSTYSKSAEGRLALAEHIRKLPLGFLESSNPARLSHSLMKDFFNLELANSHFLPQLASSLLVALLIFIGLCVFNYKMALAFFCCVPLAAILLALTRKIGKHFSTKHMAAILNASNHLNEYIDGIREIKAHNLGGAKFKRLERSFETLRKESIKIEVGLMPFALAIISCMGAGIGIMIAAGRGFLVSGEMSVMTYIGFILVGSKAFVPLLTLSISFIEMQYLARSGSNVLSLLAKPQMSGSDKALPSGNDIVLENVSFAYKKDAPLVIKDINLTIPAGSSLAIVGPSGSGKSTLVKLIARFYDVSSGSIKIGDCGDSQKGDDRIGTCGDLKDCVSGAGGNGDSGKGGDSQKGIDSHTSGDDRIHDSKGLDSHKGGNHNTIGDCVAHSGSVDSQNSNNSSSIDSQKVGDSHTSDVDRIIDSKAANSDNNSQNLKDIRSLEPEALMSKFSMVFQNVYLFGNSIRENVAFGKEDATREEIESALSAAQASGFVNALNSGIESKVAEGGASLSGGEKQRISIARAILKNAPIILLDEISSSLDVYNEYALQKAINNLTRDKSMIIIAHKLKNVMNCDNIVYLKHGEIIESGTHEQLLAHNGEYAKMWRMQQEVEKCA